MAQSNQISFLHFICLVSYLAHSVAAAPQPNLVLEGEVSLSKEAQDDGTTSKYDVSFGYSSGELQLDGTTPLALDKSALEASVTAIQHATSKYADSLDVEEAEQGLLEGRYLRNLFGGSSETNLPAIGSKSRNTAAGRVQTPHNTPVRKILKTSRPARQSIDQSDSDHNKEFGFHSAVAELYRRNTVGGHAADAGSYNNKPLNKRFLDRQSHAQEVVSEQYKRDAAGGYRPARYSGGARGSAGTFHSAVSELYKRNVASGRSANTKPSNIKHSGSRIHNPAPQRFSTSYEPRRGGIFDIGQASAQNSASNSGAMFQSAVSELYRRNVGTYGTKRPSIQISKPAAQRFPTVRQPRKGKIFGSSRPATSSSQSSSQASGGNAGSSFHSEVSELYKRKASVESPVSELYKRDAAAPKPGAGKKGWFASGGLRKGVGANARLLDTDPMFKREEQLTEPLQARTLKGIKSSQSSTSGRSSEAGKFNILSNPKSVGRGSKPKSNGGLGSVNYGSFQPKASVSTGSPVEELYRRGEEEQDAMSRTEALLMLAYLEAINSPVASSDVSDPPTSIDIEETHAEKEEHSKHEDDSVKSKLNTEEEEKGLNELALTVQGLMNRKKANKKPSNEAHLSRRSKMPRSIPKSTPKSAPNSASRSDSAKPTSRNALGLQNLSAPHKETGRHGRPALNRPSVRGKHGLGAMGGRFGGFQISMADVVPHMAVAEMY